MKLAKTRTNLTYSLLAILGVVFAFIIGVTYCASAFVLNVGSNGYSTSAFMAKQQYAVINDSETTPIPFGTGSHNYEVAIQYSYSYDIDIRIKYSLSWTDGLDTNNVILNYSNRDNFIVDDTYIFVRDTLTAGSGKLTIFTGVDFTDSTDLAYIGAYLTINIEEVKIYKAQDTYSSSHPLVNGIDMDTYPSARAWITYKQGNNSSNAYVIAYNRLYANNGAQHPINAGAYYRGNNSYRWLGGNQFYAGVGVYIVTGSSPIKLTARVSARWVSSNGVQTGQIYENNIMLNYSDGWVKDSGQSNEIFPTYYYNKVIPAHSAVYIEIVDNLEITTRGSNNDRTVYQNREAIIYTLNLNNVDNTSSTLSSSGITTFEIASSTSNLVSSVSTQYSQEDYDIINSTDYVALMYNYNQTAAQQVYEVNISVTNNTANTLRINSRSFSLGYYLSNGNNSTDVANIFDPSQTIGWYRDESVANSNYVSVQASLDSYLPPYSTTNISTYFTVTAGFQTDVIANAYGNYDCYIYIIPNITVVTSSDTIAQADIEFGIEENSNTGVFYLKNNTSSLLDISSTTLQLQKINYEFTPLQSFPSTWNNDYWQYYVYDSDSGIYVRNITDDQSAGAMSFYQLTINSESVSLNSAVTYNGFSRAGNTFSNSNLKLKPGESIKVASIELSSTITNGYVRYALQYLNSALPSVNSTASANNSIDILFEGNLNAYIFNNTDTNYFVRYTGTSETNNNVVTDNGWNYYIGIVRAGQITKIPMTNVNGKIAVEYIEVPSVYTSSTLSSWTNSQTVLSAYERYFLGE